jgi:hypothetical protein
MVAICGTVVLPFRITTTRTGFTTIAKTHTPNKTNTWLQRCNSPPAATLAAWTTPTTVPPIAPTAPPRIPPCRAPMAAPCTGVKTAIPIAPIPPPTIDSTPLHTPCPKCLGRVSFKIIFNSASAALTDSSLASFPTMSLLSAMFAMVV